MRHFYSVTKETLQMFSGAAGLIAGFAAISLSFLLLQGPIEAHSISSRPIMIAGLALGLGWIALFLLRFSLTRTGSATSLRSHTLHPHH